MTNKFKTKIISLLLASVMTVGMATSNITVVHAEETETENTVEQTQVPRKPITAYETIQNHAEDAHQVYFTAECPENFDASVTVEFVQDSNGQEYVVYLDAENGYSGNIFVPANDHYTIKDVFCANISKFKFIVDETGFTSQTKGSSKLNYRMADLEDIIQKEDGSFDYKEDASSRQNMFATPYSFIKMDKNGTLYYDVTYNGNSRVSMTASGYSRKDYNAIVSITQGGIIGEAKYKVSFDNGASWSSEYTTSYGRTFYPSGITIGFHAARDTNELIAGEQYTFKTIGTYSVDGNTNLSQNMMMAIGKPTVSHKFGVQFMSSGKLGAVKARVGTINEDNKMVNGKIMTIPKDGILKLEDNVVLIFKDGGEYNKGQEYIVTIALGEVVPINYTPLYIMGGVLFFGAVAGFFYLVSKKEKKQDYVIIPYKDKQDKDAYK